MLCEMAIAVFKKPIENPHRKNTVGYVGKKGNIQ